MTKTAVSDLRTFLPNFKDIDSINIFLKIQKTFFEVLANIYLRAMVQSKTAEGPHLTFNAFDASLKKKESV